jgi:hypothetical protein
LGTSVKPGHTPIATLPLAHPSRFQDLRHAAATLWLAMATHLQAGPADSAASIVGNNALKPSAGRHQVWGLLDYDGRGLRRGSLAAMVNQ